MGALTQALQFILSLSILIVLHEMGHFIPAKLFKTRVEKFYLFFDPWFSLFKYKKGDTEYGIGWLPLGGYVKISGMIDESMDKEQMKLPPQDWEFRSKPAWQRLIIMCGGVTVNVILGILIYAMMLFGWGSETLPPQNATYGVSCDSLALKMGLRDGDKILMVDTVPVKSLEKVFGDILINKAKNLKVDRNGEIVNIPVSEDNLSEMISKQSHLVEPRYPLDVLSLTSGKAASAAGILVDDRIVSINDVSTPFVSDVTNELKKNKSKTINIGLSRKGKDIVTKVAVDEDGFIGVGINTDIKRYFTLKTVHYSFFESFPAGIHKAGETFDNYIKQFKIIFTVKGAAKELGGFMAIGKGYSKTWDWESFWSFTAFLSIALAFMNILPIPALDGGHVMFLLYEVITRRKPNEKFMEYAQYVGMFLLLALLLFANGNDVIKLFRK